jgi:hypothetical protein
MRRMTALQFRASLVKEYIDEMMLRMNESREK